MAALMVRDQNYHIGLQGWAHGYMWTETDSHAELGEDDMKDDILA